MTKNELHPLTIETYANGRGQWRAQIKFKYTMSYSDERPYYNLDANRARNRRRARAAIVREITQREQTTTETYAQARARVNASLAPLRVIAQDIDAQNRWHGITYGE